MTVYLTYCLELLPWLNALELRTGAAGSGKKSFNDEIQLLPFSITSVIGAYFQRMACILKP